MAVFRGSGFSLPRKHVKFFWRSLGKAELLEIETKGWYGTMIIKNAEVYTENGIFEKKDIYISGGKFVEKPEESDQEIVDGAGCYAIPGLTDIHFHGYGRGHPGHCGL